MDSLNEDILVLRLDDLFVIEKTLNLFVALLKQYEFGRSWLFPGDVVIVYLKKDFQN